MQKLIEGVRGASFIPLHLFPSVFLCASVVKKIFTAGGEIAIVEIIFGDTPLRH